jgi:hypothetical protein
LYRRRLAERWMRELGVDPIIADKPPVTLEPGDGQRDDGVQTQT